MKRLILFLAVGLLIGLGGGTGVAILRAGSSAPADSSTRAAPADSTVTITAPHVEAKVDSSTQRVEAEPTSAESRGNDAGAPHPTTPPVSTSPAPAPSAPAQEPAHAVSPPTGATARTAPEKPDTTERPREQPQLRRISRIFAAMSPKEAASVLKQLDDADVQLILAALSEKQAAAVLAQFPADRAAAVSRAALRSGGRNP